MPDWLEQAIGACLVLVVQKAPTVRCVMPKLALYVPLEAKPGKEEAVAEFLRAGLPLVEAEPGTVAWFGVRLGPTSFAIFDAFPGEDARCAHLSGKVAAALMEKADELFASPPTINKLDVLAAKLPRLSELSRQYNDAETGGHGARHRTHGGVQ